MVKKIEQVQSVEFVFLGRMLTKYEEMDEIF